MVASRMEIPEERLAAFCQKWGIAELSLFGSILQGNFRPNSDVDLLYSMLPGRVCGFNEYFEMKHELETLFGRPVDFLERSVVEESPNWIRRRAILSSAKTIYAGR